MKKYRIITGLLLMLAMLIGVTVNAAEIVANGATNVSLYLVMEDRNGDPNTNITVTTLDMYYVEDGLAAAAKIDCTDLGSENAAHVDGGCYEIGTSGLYRFDFPDEAFDGGIGKRVNLWIDDVVTGTRTAFLCVMLTPPVNADALDGQTDSPTAMDTFWGTANAAAYLTEIFITDHATNYDSTFDMWNVDMEKANGSDIPCTTAQLISDGASASSIVDEWETQSIADPTGFRVNVMEIGGTAQTANDNGADINTLINQTKVTLTGTEGVGTSTATTIVLTGGVATDGYYNGQLVTIISGTGVGQSRRILTYVAAGTIATVTRDWTVTPNATSVFIVSADDYPAILEAGTATAGAAATITLDSTASAIANTYVDEWIMITGGTGAGQTRLISAYSAGKVCTITPVWTTAPDNTSVYQIVPAARVDISKVAGTLQTAYNIGAGLALMDTADEMQLLVWDSTTVRALTELDEDNTTIDLDNTTVNATATPNYALSTTVAVGSSTTVFTLTAGVQNDDAFNYMVIAVQDAGDSHWESRTISDYVGTSRTITVSTAFSFTPANGDTVRIIESSYVSTSSGGGWW